MSSIPTVSDRQKMRARYAAADSKRTKIVRVDWTDRPSRVVTETRADRMIAAAVVAETEAETEAEVKAKAEAYVAPVRERTEEDDDEDRAWVDNTEAEAEEKYEPEEPITAAQIRAELRARFTKR
jgi:hypothetical protein